MFFVLPQYQSKYNSTGRKGRAEVFYLTGLVAPVQIETLDKLRCFPGNSFLIDITFLIKCVKCTLWIRSSHEEKINDTRVRGELIINKTAKIMKLKFLWYFWFKFKNSKGSIRKLVGPAIINLFSIFLHSKSYYLLFYTYLFQLNQYFKSEKVMSKPRL